MAARHMDASKPETASAYQQRVHVVMDHIRRNLAEELSLAALAKVAHFSPHHFHRIFKGVTGETVGAFTRRARLERAVYLMRAAPQRELGSIALEVGFGTQSDFTRVFRRHYGMAPSSWDRTARLDGLPDVALAMRGSDPPAPPSPPRIVQRPASRLAYVRVRDPWNSTNLREGYRRLTEWLRDRGIDGSKRSLVGLSWDSEKATPMQRLVYDLGFEVDADLEAEHDFGVHELPAVRAVEIHCTALPQTALAWDYLYASWLPRSRYEPADLPATKRFRHAPEVFDETAWNVDCSIALRPRWGSRAIPQEW